MSPNLKFIADEHMSVDDTLTPTLSRQGRGGLAKVSIKEGGTFAG